ncbi:MAG: hypothetical protein AAFY57_18800 [Cyanobacteria bacterium J06642_2]
MNLRETIERMEELIVASSSIPLTRIKLIRERELLNYLDRIRLSLPGALAEAERMLAEREGLIRQAQAHAQNIIDTAQERADQLVHESVISRRAEQEAVQIRERALKERQETLQQTRQESERVRNEMDRYADSVLGDLERRLFQSLNVIRDSRAQLERSPHARPERQEER